MVGDAKYNDIREPMPLTIYLDTFEEGRRSQFTLCTSVEPGAVAPEVRATVRELLKTVPDGQRNKPQAATATAVGEKD